MNAFMKAAVYHGANDIRFEETEIPHPGEGEILVQVTAASICGTDLRILHGQHRKYPNGTVRIPGHEAAGIIAEIGKGTVGYRVGESVFIAPNWGCGKCRQCASGNNNRCENYSAIGINVDGAFAEYVLVPAAAVLQGCVMHFRPGVDPAAAALIEPFACVLRGQDSLKIQPGEVVVVAGAGPIGQMHIQLARLRGAGKVIVSEVNPDRRSMALTAGADLAIDPLTEDLEARVLAESGSQGADVVVVAAPVHSVMQQAVRIAGTGGRISFFAGLPKDLPIIQMDANLIHYKELSVTGTTACSTGDCRRAAEIVDSGRIDLSRLVSRRFPLEQVVSAFTAAEDRLALKVVLEP